MSIQSNQNPGQDPLQRALFQAAKVGHIQLMRELIAAGANFFDIDEKGHTVLSYAYKADSEGTVDLITSLKLDPTKWRLGA
jgi:ankyrin repeat protein